MCKQGDNIYYRKDGRWEGRYIKGRNLDGTIRYGYVYRKSRKETKRVLDMFNSVNKLKNLHPIPEFDLTIKEWKNIWLRQIEFTVKPSTLSNYKYKLNKYIMPFFGSEKLHNINEETIYLYLSELHNEKLSFSSIRSIFCLFKQILTAGLIRINCDSSFLLQIKLPKKKPLKGKALSLQDQKKLTVIANRAPLEIGLPTLIALHTGMRIGEISALKWNDIDFEKNLICVNKTCQRIFTYDRQKSKTRIHIDSTKSDRSERIIPMTPFIKKKFLDLKPTHPVSWVFSIKGNPCEPRLLTNYFHKLRNEANLNDIHFHQLRHTFATRCLEALSDIPTVSALLGHQSTQLTLDIYSDVLIEQRSETIKKVAQYIS